MAPDKEFPKRPAGRPARRVGWYFALRRGTVELDPVRAKLEFAQIVDEALLQFTSQANVSVKIRIDIEAQSRQGFGEGTQRAVKENATVLKFKTSEFK